MVEDLYKKGLTPSIKFDKAPESYGDGNVVMLFNNRLNLEGQDTYDAPRDKTDLNKIYRPDKDERKKRWRDSGVGIYQGQRLLLVIN